MSSFLVWYYIVGSMAAVIVILLIGCFFWKRQRTGKAHSTYLVSGNFSREQYVVWEAKIWPGYVYFYFTSYLNCSPQVCYASCFLQEKENLRDTISMFLLFLVLWLYLIYNLLLTIDQCAYNIFILILKLWQNFFPFLFLFDLPFGPTAPATVL